MYNFSLISFCQQFSPAKENLQMEALHISRLHYYFFSLDCLKYHKFIISLQMLRRNYKTCQLNKLRSSPFIPVKNLFVWDHQLSWRKKKYSKLIETHKIKCEVKLRDRFVWIFILVTKYLCQNIESNFGILVWTQHLFSTIKFLKCIDVNWNLFNAWLTTKVS